MGHAERKHINMYAVICEVRFPVLGTAYIILKENLNYENMGS